MSEFKILEEGAFGDYEFEAVADTLEGLFDICARATFEAMTDVSKIKAEKEIQFEISAESIEELLYAFLAEIIYIKDVENIFLRKFDLDLEGSFTLKCKARGENIDRKKHVLRTDVKAVTYHKLEIKKIDGGYGAHVILDL